MLFIILGLVALSAVALIAKRLARGGVNDAKLGSMSERWLAENRASHPT